MRPISSICCGTAALANLPARWNALICGTLPVTPAIHSGVTEATDIYLYLAGSRPDPYASNNEHMAGFHARFILISRSCHGGNRKLIRAPFPE